MPVPAPGVVVPVPVPAAGSVIEKSIVSRTLRSESISPTVRSCLAAAESEKVPVVVHVPSSFTTVAGATTSPSAFTTAIASPGVPLPENVTVRESTVEPSFGVMSVSGVCCRGRGGCGEVDGEVDLTLALSATDLVHGQVLHDRSRVAEGARGRPRAVFADEDLRGDAVAGLVQGVHQVAGGTGTGERDRAGGDGRAVGRAGQRELIGGATAGSVMFTVVSPAPLPPRTSVTRTAC